MGRGRIGFFLAPVRRRFHFGTDPAHLEGMLSADQREAPHRVHAYVVADGFQPAYIREVVNALARGGMSVRLIGGDIHDSCTETYVKGVEFVNYRGDNSPGRAALRKVRDLVAYYFRLIADVHRSKVHAVYKAGLQKPFLDGVLINFLFRLLGAKVIHTVHNVLPHEDHAIKNRFLVLGCIPLGS